MKDTFYFSHDYNSRTDDKIKCLIRKHGMIGYGIFWAIVEDLYNNANALQTDYDGIAFDLHTDSGIVKSIVNDFGLFQIEDGYFGSKSIERRIDERNNKSAKARESAYKRWNNANAMPTQCEGNAIKERKGKEKKGEENKEKEIIFTDEFCNFWNLYDKKVGDKEKIFKKWQKLPHAVKEKIFQTLPAFVKAHPDKQYRPNPETYLNNKRWNDEIYSKKEGYKVPTI